MYQQPEQPSQSHPEQLQAMYPTQQPIVQPMPPQQFYQPMPPQQQVYPQQQPMQPYAQGYPAQQPMPQQYYQPAPQPIVVAPVINNQIVNQVGVMPQHQTLPMIVRLLWFLFIGWYFGFFWIGIALSFCCSFIGLPIGIWMFNRTGKAFFLW